VRWPGQARGAIALSLNFLFLFVSRQKEKYKKPFSHSKIASALNDCLKLDASTAPNDVATGSKNQQA
jgi:hypothetical protein